MLIGIRPGDGAYVEHTGAVFHAQDEQQNQNVPYYEIQGTNDEIIFEIRDNISGLANPILTLYTHWGEVDFDLIDDVDGDIIVSEQSGFDSDLWMAEVDGRSGRFKITQFDTTDGVDGTQAAWLPFIGVANAEV